MLLLTDAGDAVDRRRQLRVAELHICGVDERLIRLDGCLQLRDLRLLGIDQLWRGVAFARERYVAIEIGLGILQLGLVALPRERCGA